ncbi:MAG: 3-dehydroquinate synthase [Desulfopila sp.]|jgi:3-dehydroquinate synthase|nr:3-dehydroquinate synthase [Desulfopila sp.]
MNELTVGLGERSYPIHIDDGCLQHIGKDLSERAIANRYCIIADDRVAALYGNTILESLSGSGIAADLLTFPEGEASKSLTTFAELCSKVAGKGYDRRDGIIALGGGVSGDLAGFVASCYMRGVPFVQIPTTLLAQVDSSVGGKTGVDIEEGKNLVGTFYQPRAVYIDPGVLETLPADQFIGGIAEVIKYGVIRDRDFFNYLRRERTAVLALNREVITKIILTSCTIKADVVAEDEKESNIRRILNYGHTIGHAVEAASNFSIIHGKAVAIGMVAAVRIAVAKGLCSETVHQEIVSLLEEYELPTEIPAQLSREQIKNYILRDKKIVSGKVAYVLPLCLGEVTITDEVDSSIIDMVLH